LANVASGKKAAAMTAIRSFDFISDSPCWWGGESVSASMHANRAQIDSMRTPPRGVETTIAAVSFRIGDRIGDEYSCGPTSSFQRSNIHRTRQAARPHPLPAMPSYFVVRRIPGPGWSMGVPLRSQALWPEHAEFMNGLGSERFVVLGGVVGTANHALLVIDAPDETAVRARLEQDPWSRSRTLVVETIEPWNVLLGDPKGTMTNNSGCLA
jgi:uncharacterized protein YciI